MKHSVLTTLVIVAVVAVVLYYVWGLVNASTSAIEGNL